MCDSQYILELSKNESNIGHPVVKGRFREILVNNILINWLPPSILCGTGIIIDNNNSVFDAGQEDIIIYDKTLCPQILASIGHPDGVFLYNSVLARIEVKSKLNRGYVKDFIEKSKKISGFKFTVREPLQRPVFGSFNLLFAYDSDCSTIETEFERLQELFTETKVNLTSGIVSMICIPKIGFIKINVIDGIPKWQKLGSNDPSERIAYFVSCVSNSCFDQRMIRQNRDIKQSIEGGLGMYLDSPYIDI